MLGLQLKLTAPQVDMLLILVFCEPVPMRWADGTETVGAPLEALTRGNFIATMSALERRGLVDHIDGREWEVTEAGRALANLIVIKARAIVELAESRVKVETPISGTA